MFILSEFTFVCIANGKKEIMLSVWKYETKSWQSKINVYISFGLEIARAFQISYS